MGLVEMLSGSGVLAGEPGALSCLLWLRGPQYPLTSKSVTQRLLRSCPNWSIVLKVEVGYTWYFAVRNIVL